VRIARSVWWPGSVESADESSIAVADRPVVFLVLVQRACEVEDDRLGERRPYPERMLDEGDDEPIRESGKELGLLIAVKPPPWAPRR
jgi:hypothetical protein